MTEQDKSPEREFPLKLRPGRLLFVVAAVLGLQQAGNILDKIDGDEPDQVSPEIFQNLRRYEIQPNDTLLTIALQYPETFSGMTDDEIKTAFMQVNPYIKNPNVIYAGDMLYLPEPLSNYVIPTVTP